MREATNDTRLLSGRETFALHGCANCLRSKDIHEYSIRNAGLIARDLHSLNDMSGGNSLLLHIMRFRVRNLRILYTQAVIFMTVFVVCSWQHLY